MMKKLLAFILCANLMTAAFAQSVFTVSPSMDNGNELMLLGESMSQNHAWVAGTDQMAGIPMIWNVATGDVTMFLYMDSIYVETYWEVMPMTGSFHSINNNGVAVGGLKNAAYVSHPIMATADGNLTYLYYNVDEDTTGGSEAYGISEDGSTIIGFHFDAQWRTNACVWTENGTVRTDLPWPTQEQMGFPVEYVSARWVSSNGNVILGYAQDDNTGAWVAVTWSKVNGEWVVNPFCSNYYQTKYYTEEGELIIPGNNPYFDFEPVALSANGDWVSLNVLARHDPSDWDNIPLNQAARYNISTNTFQVVNFNEGYTELRMFGIADNGTAVGRLTGEMDFETWDQPVDAVVWASNGTSLHRISEMYADDEYCAGMTASALSFITADASYIMGYASNANMEQTTFVVALRPIPADAGIENVEAEISLYPNPATTRMAINSDEMIRSISILDIKGQMIRAQNVDASQAVLDVQDLANGMYLLSIVTDNGRIVKKVAVTR